MSYMTRDELNKYLKGLPASPASQNPPSPAKDIQHTPTSPAGAERRTSSNVLRGPRPPTISSPRIESPITSSPTASSIDDIKADLTYPFERKLNLNDQNSVTTSAQKLTDAVGTTRTNAKPSPPVKAKPANLARKPSASRPDPFEASLSRGKPLPPATKQSVTIPCKADANPTTQLPKPFSPPATENQPVSVTKPFSPPASTNQKVSVPNPLYSSIKCGGCEKAISGVVINAMGKRWHANCFKCKQCGENLEHMAFFEKDGFPYCGLDYHEQFSLRCDYCGTPIEEKSINALGKHYHEGHFFCRECGNPFDEGGFMVHDGHPYCEKDYLKKFGQKCMGCDDYISGEFLNALGGDWHKHCFVCTECKEPFDSETFYVKNNKPFCQRHYKSASTVKTSSICAACGDYIEGRAASALNQKWHPNHFNCVSCGKELSANVPGKKIARPTVCDPFVILLIVGSNVWYIGALFDIGMWQDNGKAEPLASYTSFLHFSSARRTLTTFANQSKIPRLPIPTLQETTERYKRSLLPLLSKQDYERASAAVADFVRPGGLGEKLQERLHALDKKEPESWLDEIWLNKAYLEYREPTLINVNWWNQFVDPPSGLITSPGAGRVSDLQLDRASYFLSQLAQFNDMINKEQVPAEVTRAGPMCMNQLKKQFGASRIPDEPRDRIITPWPTSANHASVIYKDQVFSVQIIGDNGEVAPIKQLREQLVKLVQQVDSIPQSELQAPIGLMTSEHRDTWTKVRKLMEKDSTNASNFKEIDGSLFALCLDDYSSELDLDKSHRNIFHGEKARNRWFDKAMQFIVENNGRAGANGEHSPADAVIPGSMFTEILKREEQSSLANNSSKSVQLSPPKHLMWNIDSSVGDALKMAENNASKMIDNLASVLLHYNEFGSDFLKRVKCSPDGFLQMSYQLAYYRQHGEPCATYESASTRLFKLGRTETVRSCSVDTVAFTKAWDDKDVKLADKIALFQKAIGTQMEYMKAASNGKCMMTAEEAANAAIFNDPSYIASMYYKLSTSNTSPGDYSWGGFGPVVPEGYGSNYAIGKERIRLSITNWKTAPEVDSVAFRKTLKTVFNDLAEAIERA
ncbi:hypothetical protein NQZ79_g7048 [Umbelopsis isabellina]|nr:hypothetical protein NQZ79_g7048 [Umbelopsis isabellina]